MKKNLPITITSRATKEILSIKERKQIHDDYCLRLGVKSAGCGIASYIIGFDYVNEKDEIYEMENFNIIIEKIQVMYLAGKSIDYGDADGETGFIFKEGN